MKFRKMTCLITALAILFTAGCANTSKQPMTYTGIALDTVISIQIYDSDNEELLTQCQALCEDYEERLSRTIETSEIARINSAGGNPVEVSDDTAALIREGIRYGELSDGAFDITIGAVTSLWDFKSEDPFVPSPDDIAGAVSHVDYRGISISGNTVTLKDPSAMLDLGAIAKGYIADRLKEYLVKEGVEHALINLGGNVLAIGGKPDGSAFNIGIQTPFDENGEPITAIQITDQTVVPSGNYQRFFEKDGVLYHHILDPHTGYPCGNALNSVSIITDSSLTADALSTTCFLLGPEAGMELIDRLDNTEAIFIDTENQITRSKGL